MDLYTVFQPSVQIQHLGGGKTGHRVIALVRQPCDDIFDTYYHFALFEDPEDANAMLHRIKANRTQVNLAEAWVLSSADQRVYTTYKARVALETVPRPSYRLRSTRMAA
jgi:hypothetical protein